MTPRASVAVDADKAAASSKGSSATNESLIAIVPRAASSCGRPSRQFRLTATNAIIIDYVSLRPID
jgi:hypothetical protein